MHTFTKLEHAVLQEIASQYPAHSAVLYAQLAAAVVQSRENTGAGFYTRFLVDRAAAPSVPCERVIGNVWAEIEGFNSPMTFLLFINESYANCLEGAAVVDKTTDADFSTLNFRLISS